MACSLSAVSAYSSSDSLGHLEFLGGFDSVLAQPDCRSTSSIESPIEDAFELLTPPLGPKIEAKAGSAVEPPNQPCILSDGRCNKSALKSIDKRVLTILLIGETGSGKTEFTSLLLNLFRGAGYLDLEDYKDPNCESGLAVTQSQTTKAKLYTIVTPDGTTIRILDTPGLADTRGIEQDDAHKKEINNAILELTTPVDAILIVANGTIQRLNITTEYTLRVIAAMFPKSIVNNIGFIFTNSESVTKNFQMAGLQPELRNAQRWPIQNPLAMLKNYREQDELDKEERQEMMIRIEQCYKGAIAKLNKLLSWLNDRQAQPTTEIERLYNLTVEMESKIEAAMFSVTQLRKQRDEYAMINAKLQDAKEQIEAAETLKKSSTKLVWCREETVGINKICLAPGCHSNCSLSCQDNLVDTIFMGLDDSVKVASSIRDCKVCCHDGVLHGRYRLKHVSKLWTSPEILQQLKSAKGQEQELEVAQRLTCQELSRIDTELPAVHQSIHDLVDKFNEISLSGNYVGHIEGIIQVLQKRKKELESDANARNEVALIDESIATFERRKDISDRQKC